MSAKQASHLFLIWLALQGVLCSGGDVQAGTDFCLDPPISYLWFHVFAIVVTLANAWHDRMITLLPWRFLWTRAQLIWHIAKWIFFYGLFGAFIAYAHPPLPGVVWSAVLCFVGWRLVYNWDRETCNTCKRLRGFVLAWWISANFFTILLELL